LPEKQKPKTACLMKRTLLILSFIFVAFTGSMTAQITITTADLPTIGLQVIRAVDNTTQINPGNPGLNQVWDFTNLVPSTYDTTLYLPPQGQINYQNYPNAEVAVKHQNGNPPPFRDYEYTRYDSEGMRFVGDEDMVTIFGAFTMSIHITCNPNPLELKLPFTYGDNYTQESTYEWHMVTRNEGVFMDSIKQISRMNITTTGDASGMMMTPYGSFQVLRVKNDIISEDSVYNWTPDGWVFNSFDVSIYSNYRWYTNDYYEVGMYQFEEAKGNSMTFFKSETVVGVQPNTMTRQLKLFPNPASRFINIETQSPFASYEIVDLTGRIQVSTDYMPVINVEALSPGLYILRLRGGNTVVSNRFLKQ
jgi:hypothetical protein